MFGLDIADIAVIAGYFLFVIGVGIWSMRRIRNQEDYFLAGRRFGKFVQTFAAFGQATSADSAIGVSTTTFNNGAAGIWSSLNMLFATPIYWMTSVWYRRMRVLTLGDYFEERYQSKSLAGIYAVIQSVFFMLLLSLAFNALGITALVLTPKTQDQLNVSEQQEYLQALEMENLQNRDYAGLSPQEKDRLRQLRIEQPKKVFSHINKIVLVFMICLVVLIYAVAGGLEAAFLTDVLQGMGIILMSVILIPFALIRTNQLYGGTGVLEPFRILYDKLPGSFFEIFGSPANIDFTWYYVVSIMVMITLTVMQQANQLTATGSAKGEYEARYGFTVGLYLKRICTVVWGLIALFAILLYSDKITDPDMVWGYASRDLLGSMKIGLVGLMFACLLAALMSTADCYMITASSLITHNIYRPLIPGKKEKYYVLVGRISGAVVIIGGAIMAMTFESLLQQMKLAWEFGVIFAAPFLLGILWRKPNKKAAWITSVFTFLFFFFVPVFLPIGMPNLTKSPYLLKTTQARVLEREYTAHMMDVEERQEMIKRWDILFERGQATGQRPEPLQEGQRFIKKYAQPEKSIFWTQGIIKDGNNELRGYGMLNIDLVLYDKMGADLSKNPYALNETIRIATRVIVPFVILIFISFITKPDDREILNRFFVKMKTQVHPDRQQDDNELRLSYENPHRFDHLKMFPKSDWEFCKWDKVDIVGFLIALAIAFGIVALFYLAVNLGRFL